MIIGGKYGCLEILDDEDELVNIIDGSNHQKQEKHYKCKCRKCGKIRYYTEETIQTLPQFCYRPMYISGENNRSNKAKNATYRKKKKYQDNEAVCLVSEKEYLIPSDEYCDKWNEKRKKDLANQKEKDSIIIASIQRKKANNFDVDFTGRIYESLEIIECVNNNLESKPDVYYTQQHKKKYRDIIKYKQYRCKCYLCGKEMLITCDEFGIYPPTPYGNTAYEGYWSKVYCNCHDRISSFQWKVNKILFEKNVNYRVEVSFSDLYGRSRDNKLRFDFAIYNEKNEIKCLIECQGEQHYKPVEGFGGVQQYYIQVQNDNIKKEYARIHSIPLIEISYKDSKYEKIEEILTKEGIID